MKFLFLLVFLAPVLTLSLKTRVKLDSHIDPFQILGIPDFKKDLESGISKNPSQTSRNPLHLTSLSDMPKLFESQDFDTLSGFKAMTRFLTEDDENLFNNGGVFDETGFDGTDAEGASLYGIGSESRNVERVKSAANLWVKKTDPMSKLEPYSVKRKNDEDLVEWDVYEVILMCCSGTLVVKRVCIEKNEEIAMIAFVLENEDKCENRVGVAEEYVERGLKYLKRIGMKKLAEEFESKRKANLVSLVKERKKLRGKDMGKIMRIGGKQEKTLQNETNLTNISDNNKKANTNTAINDVISKSLPAIPNQKKEKKGNADFEFKEKEEESHINNINNNNGNTNKNNNEVNELKQEVTLLKDDLKDLKQLLKESLSARTPIDPPKIQKKPQPTPQIDQTTSYLPEP